MFGRARRSCNPAALTQLGLTEEDVPANWMELFQLLQRLPEMLEEAPEVNVFESYMTQSDARQMLFSALMDDYMLYISQPENEFSFDTPLFRELMAAFEAVDFEALGLSEEYEDDLYAIVQDRADTLFYGYGSFDPTVSSEPPMLCLALDEGMQPMADTMVMVAFVNPFSPNRDLAIEYLECAAEQVDAIMRIAMMPGENEPVLNSRFEEALKNYDAQIASLEAQLENAEEVDKQALEAELKEMKDSRESYEKDSRYTASEESIAAYREAAQYMTVGMYMGMDSETASEYYAQQNQYLNGAITLDEFIRNIDQKLRMIVREGQ